MRAAILLAAALCFGCQQEVSEHRAFAAPAPANHSMLKLREDISAFGADLDRAEADATRLQHQWQPVLDSYHRSAQEFEEARLAFERAEQDATHATRLSKVAAERAKQAEKRFRLYQAMVLVAAQIDAGNLDSYRSWRSAQSANSEFDCAPVNTAKFRRHLLELGISLAGKDVDHIVPRSLGGADHPSNYQLLDSSTNRSLGNTWNRQKCIAVGSRCAEAMAVSMKCGSYAGPGL